MDWLLATPVDDFVQIEPNEGQLASERTSVHVLFDRDNLYFGVTCSDSKGARALRVRDLRRDFDDTTDDFFGIAIDGVRDTRSALVFRVNPFGALRDQATVDGGLADADFDAVWRARTSRSDTGWTAEIAIPWRTLRYQDGAHEWGINFQRIIRRTNENVGWAPWPRAGVPFRMDVAGILTGLEPPPTGRNVRLQPYIVTTAGNPTGAVGSLTGNVGGDVKWAASPNAIVDVTVNPDFGQSDVDRQVVNLTRFSVFFPERRQFFLENRGVFFTGNGGRFEPFFSRRIGLDAAGNPIPIRGGGRITTRTARQAFGAMAVSQGGDDPASRSDFAVLRYVANFSGQNRLGALATTRVDHGGQANIVAGIDGFWRPTRTSFVRGTLTRSSSSGTGGEGYGGYVWAANETNRGYFGYISEIVTGGYDARSGFTLRNDYVRISPAITLDWRPRWRPSAIRRFQPGFTLEHYVTASNRQVQEGFISLRPMTVQLQSGATVQYTLQPNWQRPVTTFRPVAGVTVSPGSYDYTRHLVTLQTDPSARLAFRFEGSTGGYFDGALHSARALIQGTPSPHVGLSIDYTLNQMVDVGTLRGSLVTHLIAAESRLAATPRLQVVALGQWNTAARQFAMNARFAWEYRPLAFFSVVYNDRNAIGGLAAASPPGVGRQLLVKCVWLFQI